MARPARPYGSAPLDPRKPPIQGALDSSKESTPQVRKEDPSPNYETVAQFHKNADSDASTTAIHHTLGSGVNQASPGDHTHDGGSSRPLLENWTIPPADGTNTVAVLNAIRDALMAIGAKGG